MDFVDLFCGIGGFRLGLEKANKEKGILRQSDLHRYISESNECRQSNRQTPSRNRGEKSFSCVWANDNDKYACQIYRKRFGDKSSGELGTRTRSTECSRSIGSGASSQGDAWKGYKDTNWDERSKLYEGDIRAVDASAIPDHSLLCAGFPCQSFSIAGKRKGFGDTRGTLFFEICRIIRAKRPRYLLLENVKGLLSHDDGHTFETIIRTLDELGYDCQWQVLNSKDFGVPQNRERVFIVGHLGGQPRPKIFPIGEADESVDKPELKYVGAIMSEQNQKWLEDGKELSRNFPQGQRVYSVEGIASNICGDAGGLGGKTGLYLIDAYNRRTIDTPTALRQNMQDGGTLVGKDTRIRRLTPLECERLQGFPDGWTEGISDTQRYKCLGNAVTVNVIEAIGRQFLEGISGQG